MKAQFVNENILDFKRGVNPKEQMDVGMTPERKIKETYDILKEIGIPFSSSDEPSSLWNLQDVWIFTVNDPYEEGWVEIICAGSDHQEEKILKGWSITHHDETGEKEELLTLEDDDINKVVIMTLKTIFPNINSNIVATQHKLNTLNKANDILTKNAS